MTIISINEAPYIRMTLELVDEMEKLVEEIAGDNGVGTVLLIAEGLDTFESGKHFATSWSRSLGSLQKGCE